MISVVGNSVMGVGLNVVIGVGFYWLVDCNINEGIRWV